MDNGRKMTKAQIKFINENTSMTAYCGIRLTEQERDLVVNSEISQTDFSRFTKALRCYNATRNSYLQLGKNRYKDNIESVIDTVNEICQRIIKENNYE